MTRSKLIELLRNCTTKERNQFKDYLNSPYFNKIERLSCLYGIVLEYSPEFADAGLKKEAVFSLLHPKQAYNEYKINNDISDILQHLYDFLALEQIKSNKARVKHFLMQDLLKRELPQHIKRTAKKYEQYHENFPYQNETFFYQAYQFYESQDNFFLYRSERFYDPNLQLKSDHLDYYFLVAKFKIACDMLTRGTVVKADYECKLLEELLLVYKKKEAYGKIPAIRQYYLAYCMLQEPEKDAAFFDFKNTLISNQTCFPKTELWVLYNYALNHCIRKINVGKSHYYKEIHELYQLMLDNKIILKNGYLSPWAFKNIVTVGLRIKDYAWTENFIVHYKKYLPKKELANAVAYNMAALYYEKSNYTLALQQLHNVIFSDASYHLGAKIIQVKSYFALDETAVLYDLVEAFRKYISRSKGLSDYRKKANDNFLKLTKSIYKLKSEKTLLRQAVFEQKLRDTKLQIQETDPLANKDWLETVVQKIGSLTIFALLSFQTFHVWQ